MIGCHDKQVFRFSCSDDLVRELSMAVNCVSFKSPCCTISEELSDQEILVYLKTLNSKSSGITAPWYKNEFGVHQNDVQFGGP